MTRNIGSAETSDWILCPGCGAPAFWKRWQRDWCVCQQCGQHERITARDRLASLLDEDSFEVFTQVSGNTDVLRFIDTASYTDRLTRTRNRTGMDEAVICGRGTICGHPVIIAVMEFGFLGGSLGAAVGEMIAKAADTALAQRTPLLLVTASGGARMQEGAVSLMQMAKTSAVLARLDDAGVLSLSLITDPTFGGVAASFATLTDVIIAEPGATLGFAGRRVIEQTIRQQLPNEFQTAEFLLERGFIDLVVPRRELRKELAHLLNIGANSSRNLEPPAVLNPAVRDPGSLPQRDSWETVGRARSLDRPTSLDYISLMCTDFQELHGDRVSGDCVAVVAGTALLNGSPIAVIGQQKGHTTAELTQRNFGMPTPAGYRKAVRIMRLAAKLRLPVITLVDTPGAYPGVEAEERGQAVAVAESIRQMTLLPVPVISIITGEGGSGGALALATANKVLMWADSIYSVISPEGCAAILWQDASAAPQAAEALGIDSTSLLSLGVVDGVLPEPEGGTGSDPMLAADRLRAAIVSYLRELRSLSVQELVDHRRERFRRFGSELSKEVNNDTVREVAL